MLDVRSAQLSDLAALASMIQEKIYPSSRLPGVTPESRRDADLATLDRQGAAFLEMPAVQVLLALRDQQPEAFWIGICGHRDHATDQPETLLVEHAGELARYPDLLALLETRAAQAGDRFLALRVYPEEKELLEALPGWGFAPEFSRIVRRLDLSSPPASGPYRIDPARAGDRPFLARLHVEYSPFYQSSNREGAEWGAFGALDNYLHLDLEPPSRLRGWVARRDGRPVGYVLVQLDFVVEQQATPAVYLYDIAVEKEEWGHHLGSLLHERAVAELYALGYTLLVGDVSWHNSRTLIYARRRLRYSLEWERWGRNLPPISS